MPKMAPDHNIKAATLKEPAAPHNIHRRGVTNSNKAEDNINMSNSFSYNFQPSPPSNGVPLDPFALPFPDIPVDDILLCDGMYPAVIREE